MSLLPLGLLSQGGGAGGAGSFEQIATSIADGSSQSVTFSSIPSTYKHLQLRITANANLATRYHLVTLNGTTSTYKNHILYGNGSSVLSDAGTPVIGNTTAFTTLNDVPSNTNQFGATIMDILDYSNTNKNKTSRTLHGAASAANQVGLTSGLWVNTAVVSSLTITCSGGGYYTNGSRFTLYGIKG
jgi:hypothetical protein